MKYLLILLISWFVMKGVNPPNTFLINDKIITARSNNNKILSIGRENINLNCSTTNPSYKREWCRRTFALNTIILGCQAYGTVTGRGSYGWSASFSFGFHGVGDCGNITTGIYYRDSGSYANCETWSAGWATTYLHYVAYSYFLGHSTRVTDGSLYVSFRCGACSKY